MYKIGRVTNRTYKDIYTIVKEIGDVWQKLDDIDRAALLEALAGKKQSNTLAAVLNNAERLEEIYQTAEESSGSAMREQEKYTESIQYSIDQLTAYGEDFWTTFINTKDVKNVINFLNIIIEKATKFVDIFGALPSTLGIAGSLFFGKSGLDLISYDSKNGFGGLFSRPKAGVQASNFLSNNFAYGITGDSNLADFVSEVGKGNIQLKEGQSALDAYNKYLKTVGASSKMVTVGTKALTATMKVLSSLGWMALITAVTWGIQKTIQAIGNYVNRAEISRKNLEEISGELENTTGELNDINKQISEIQAKGKLSLTDKVDLQNLQKQKSILEDQVRLLELKKELAANKSNSDAVSTANNKNKGYGWKGAYIGFKSDQGIIEDILGKDPNGKGGSLHTFYGLLEDVNSDISNETDDEEKLARYYDRKRKTQVEIDKKKALLSDIYSRNLELIDQITGDDPASKAAREKLIAQNELMEQYLFTAEEIAQKNLQKFKSKFANYYNEQLDLAQDDASHIASKDIIDKKTGDNLGIYETGVTEAGLDGLISKAKELNQSFVDGKITASEYFDNLSSEIEKINLDDVGAKLDGGNGDNPKTDYLEQTIATLSSQVSDAMLYADASFKAGELSVGEYIDTLGSGINAQKKLLKSTYNLTEGEDGLVEITEDMDDATKNAAESFNGLVESQNELSELDKFADSFGALVDEMLEAGYIEDNNITEKLLGDPALFSQTVTTLSDEMRRLYSEGGQAADELANTLSESFGVTKDQMKKALGGAKGNLEALVGENVNAVNAMENAAANNASNTIKNASQAVGKVLKALGDAISKFEYKLEATPYLKGNTNIIDRDEDGKIRVNSPATFGWTFKGSGGDSIKNISEALRSAGNYFDKPSEPLEIIDWGSVKTNNNDDDDDDDNTFDIDKKGKKSFDDNYYSTVDAWLKENEKEIERLEKEREALNRQFENALDAGNKEQAEILQAKLIENAKAQKDILHRQNDAHRITKSELLASLYEVAPELNDKVWEEISEVTLTEIENRLNKAVEDAGDNETNKNQAKLKLNRFKGLVEDIKSVDDAIKENSASWWDKDAEIADYYSSQIDFQENYSREWIDNEKAFNKLSEEEELAAYGRMVNNNKEFQKQILEQEGLSAEEKLALIKKTNDLIISIEKDAYDVRASLFDKASGFANTYLESQKTILQSHYDVTNSITEARHELNKELETSMTMYAYLDEETRKLLFNQEDYNKLTQELNTIENESLRLQSEYEEKLRNSTLETVESIISEYQMQYETLMKSYNIAKADLEIAKKKQQLNNVLNERNVKMLIDGKWQWVANADDVAKAKSELADAEYAKRVEEAGLTQQQSIDNLTRQQDALGVVIKQFENGVISLDDAVRLATQAIGSMPSALASMFSGAKTSSYSSFSSSTVVSSGSSKNINSDYVSWAKSQMAENSKNWHTADANGKKALEAANQSLGAAIGSTYDKTTGKWTHKLATGTKYTQSGLTLMGEEGEEFYIQSGGRFVPITQPTIGNIGAGGIVFNTEQMSNLRNLWDLSNLSRINTSGAIVNRTAPSGNNGTQNNFAGDIIINSPRDYNDFVKQLTQRIKTKSV